jgi:hypothetical protein
MALGGVGEAMLLGAAMGGGSAALTGGDPLKGALLGGLTGGAGAGISGALSSAFNPAVSLATTAPAVAGTGLTAGTTAATAGSTLGGSIGNSLAAIDPTLASVAPNVGTNVATAANPGITSLASNLPTSTANQILSKVAPNAVPPPAVMPSGVANNPLLNTADVGNFASPNYSLGKSVVGDVGPINYSLAKSAAPVTATPEVPETFAQGMKKFMDDPLASIKRNPITAASSAYRGATGARKKPEEPEEYDGPLKRFKFNPSSYQSSFFAAEGGIADLAGGGYDRMVGEQPMYQAMAKGGISDLGGYSDYARGGRMLKGPGDGMSDSIPASISGKRPARLADGEFVIPADVVSHLGNGSTDAGAKQLYAMMNKVRQARTGRKAQGREINPRQYVPA